MERSFDDAFKLSNTIQDLMDEAEEVVISNLNEKMLRHFADRLHMVAGNIEEYLGPDEELIELIERARDM